VWPLHYLPTLKTVWRKNRHNPSSPSSPTMFKCLLIAALIVSVAVAADVGELCADYANTTYNRPCLRSGLPHPAWGGGGAGEGTCIMLPLSGPQWSCSRSVGPRTTSGKPDVPRTTITRRTWARVLLCAFPTCDKLDLPAAAGAVQENDVGESGAREPPWTAPSSFKLELRRMSMAQGDSSVNIDVGARKMVNYHDA
jgi:hypothetical protein